MRERAFAKRHARMEERLNTGSRALPPLQCGDHVSLQDPAKNGKAGRWSKTAQVLEVGDHDTYTLKVDGSNRLTSRNRRFLRKITPFSTTIQDMPTTLFQPSQVTQAQPTQVPQPASAQPQTPSAQPQTPSAQPQIVEVSPEPSSPQTYSSSPRPASHNKTLLPVSRGSPPSPGVVHDYSAMKRDEEAARRAVLRTR